MILEFFPGALLFLLTAAGVGWPIATALKLDPAEKIVTAVALSLVGFWLFAWSVYVLNLRSSVLWGFPLLSALGLLFRGRALATTLRDPDVRSLVLAQGLVTGGCVVWLSLVSSYSGGLWTSDWFEHWERALFFILHQPLDHQFLGLYSLPARPPLANIVTAALLILTQVDFAHYQFFSTLFSSLAFLPAALLARRFHFSANPTTGSTARSTITVLAALILVNPLFIQNATFPWTKLPAVFFVLLAVYFFLRTQDPGSPRTAAWLFAVALAASILVHYSAGPYVVILSAAWWLAGWRRRRDPEWWRSTGLAAGTGGLLLATWFAWSLATFGWGVTFLSNTSVAATGRYQGNKLLKIVLNLRDTLIPHFFRPVDSTLFAQTSHWGKLRDWFFQSYQLNLFFAFGCIGGVVLVRELWRAAQVNRPSIRFGWTVALCALVVLSISVQGERDKWGLTHICLQSAVVLGLAFLAARWDNLEKLWRRALIAGAVFDFIFGIGLHFLAQSGLLDHPAPGEYTAFNATSLMNFAAKVQHQLIFFADFSPAPPILRLALAGAILMLAVARARRARMPSLRPSCPTPRFPSPS